MQPTWRSTLDCRPARSSRASGSMCAGAKLPSSSRNAELGTVLCTAGGQGRCMTIVIINHCSWRAALTHPRACGDVASSIRGGVDWTCSLAHEPNKLRLLVGHGRNADNCHG